MPGAAVEVAPTMARSPNSSAAQAGDSARERSPAAQLVLSLRPAQWTKNLIVFAGLIFGERLFDPSAVAAAGVAFGVFCALSGVVYLVNDVRDREADRLHPTKRFRPIASGALDPRTALATAAILATGALLMSLLALSPAFAAIAVGYLILNLLYSTWLKHLVILDVLTIAIGFVLRAWGGAVAVDVTFSHWLLLLTLLLALFLGLSKRRAELVALADGASGHRRILAEYSPYLLDQMISVVTASTLLAYAFYTISPDTVARFGTDRLLWTVPFPLYGIFRYLYLVHQREGGGNPSEMLVADRPLLLCVALWIAAVVVIVYGSWPAGASS
jgi:4-hydroxybenzoate polyprenyltransferase